MERFIQLVIDGIAIGSIYGALALALVLIFRSTGLVNFAQGEMAMFSTFIAWGLVEAGLPLGLALVSALAALLHRRDGDRAHPDPAGRGRGPADDPDRHARPVHPHQLRRGLDLGLREPRLPARAARRLGRHRRRQRLRYESLGIVAVLLGVSGLLFLLFNRTKLGLAMRAAAANPASARLVGIDVGRTLMIGWGLAALLGALAGVLVAPQLFLDVNFMGGVLVYSFAAATLGGFDSPKGAIIGGWIIGVAETLAGDYIGFIGSDLTILVPLAIIFGVLLVRPNGLFGSPEVVRA